MTTEGFIETGIDMQECSLCERQDQCEETECNFVLCLDDCEHDHVGIHCLGCETADYVTGIYAEVKHDD